MFLLEPKVERFAEDKRFYFTGKPCKYGHVAQRYSCNNECSECRKEKNIALKEKQTNRVGKIDLVSFRQDTKTIYLIELKRLKSKGTLLKCTLEIATYYKQLHHQNFLKSETFRELGANNIKKALLIFKV